MVYHDILLEQKDDPHKESKLRKICFFCILFVSYNMSAWTVISEGEFCE